MNKTRKEFGDMGENAVIAELKNQGWSVEDLNTRKANYPNSDLCISKNSRSLYVQVKACSRLGWISAGGVNPGISEGEPIFNRADGFEPASFVICVTPKREIIDFALPSAWRCFVLPVLDAERLFRVNIDAYFNGRKKDGNPRKKSGACQDFVGPGKINSTVVPDHQEDYAPYENRFNLLDQAL